MTNERPKAVTSGGSERFGDSMLAFGLTRFEAKSYQKEEALWRFRVSRGCNGDPIFDIDAKPADLLKMRAWLDRAIETIATDGGRKAAPDGR